MPGHNPNLYQRARKESPYTQERAAELLHVSETTVKAWEQGQRTPDNRTVAMMAEIYNTPWLRLERALETLEELGITEAGNAPENLPSAVLDHYGLSLDLMDGYRRFIQITADGRIDETEEDDYTAYQSLILRNCVSGLRLVFCPTKGIKKDRPDAGTSERFAPRPKSKNDRKNYFSTSAGGRQHLSRRGGAQL